MILFFAGHGGLAVAPGNRMTDDGKVHTIYPVDARTTNAAGEYVHAIPNYVLGWLRCELAEKKGPNIVRSVSVVRPFLAKESRATDCDS
jgi:hypothetical protein